MHDKTDEITRLILKAAEKARAETDGEPEPGLAEPVQWPVQCTAGPGLEGAIACESKVGYVNGTKGWLIYRGYDIFDLAANSTYEEVSFLLLHGRLPSAGELADFSESLANYRLLHDSIRHLMAYPVAEMNSMAALRLGTLLMRQTQTYRDKEQSVPDVEPISTDEDSQPMEREVKGAAAATYEFTGAATHRPSGVDTELLGSEDAESCYHLLAGCETIAAAIARIQAHRMPLEPLPDLSHAGNMIYMMTGRRPTPIEERVMDVALILHADHGMNASTFAAMQVASTLSDIYFAVGAGIAALNGPLHGGANADSLRQLEEIGSPGVVDDWFQRGQAEKKKVVGFGHRVYKTYDPRARILRPLAHLLARDHARTGELMAVAERLEERVVSTLGQEKGVFPNVDFYSGIVYNALGIPSSMFTPLFAVARVAGWTARVLEYLQNNRIFRPRAVYTGPFDLRYVPLAERP